MDPYSKRYRIEKDTNKEQGFFWLLAGRYFFQRVTREKNRKKREEHRRHLHRRVFIVVRSSRELRRSYKESGFGQRRKFCWFFRKDSSLSERHSREGQRGERCVLSSKDTKQKRVARKEKQKIKITKKISESCEIPYCY